MGPGPFGAGDLFGGGCKTVCENIVKGGKMIFSPLAQCESEGCEDLDRIYHFCFILIKEFNM